MNPIIWTLQEAVSHQEVDLKKQAIKCVVRQLPPYHYSTLSYLMQVQIIERFKLYKTMIKETAIF